MNIRKGDIVKIKEYDEVASKLLVDAHRWTPVMAELLPGVELKVDSIQRGFVIAEGFPISILDIDRVVKKVELPHEVVIAIISRILGFPFFLGLATCGALVMLLKWIVNYIRFGGEAIAYTQENNRKTIYDVYRKLNERKD